MTFFILNQTKTEENFISSSSGENSDDLMGSVTEEIIIVKAKKNKAVCNCGYLFTSCFAGNVSSVHDNRVQSFYDVATKQGFPRHTKKIQVSLQRNGTHFCGGTILDETHILTAAHCVCDDDWDVLDVLEVKFTSLELDDPNAVSIHIDSVICNNYDILELIRDTAILNLVETIPASFFEPVKLPESNFSTALPLYGIVVGWGLTKTAGATSNILQKVDVVVYNDALCEKSYFGTRNIKHQICSGWPLNDRGSCQGDSGGPLLVGGVQIGVISFGDDSDCAVSDADTPKISARVSAYLEWIYNVIEPDEETITSAVLQISIKNEADQSLGIITEQIRGTNNGSNKSRNV
ncbi:chymotrypsin-1-like [Anoplophora glabripennis]|uniref:chymotrypsin-1-like n=1 Tax=Anoplophora glabripennis TaxID=217634 RepID=UPI000873ACF1|nr:chymotrypsin-1-like [Anoplophora glabripennis]